MAWTGRSARLLRRRDPPPHAPRRRRRRGLAVGGDRVHGLDADGRAVGAPGDRARVRRCAHRGSRRRVEGAPALFGSRGQHTRIVRKQRSGFCGPRVRFPFSDVLISCKALLPAAACHEPLAGILLLAFVVSAAVLIPRRLIQQGLRSEGFRRRSSFVTHSLERQCGGSRSPGNRMSGFLDEWLVRHEPLDRNRSINDDHDRKSRSTSGSLPNDHASHRKL